jgi:competence protein CoiA
MMLATLNGDRAQATPGLTGAACPGCGLPVVPKCGQVNIWHWAHARGADCDPWYEPMSEWHLSWQQSVPPDRREVVIGNHRADIVTARGQVVEIQHSHLSTVEIAERERHYGPMVWIFDAIDAATGPTTRHTRGGQLYYDAPRLDIRSTNGSGPAYRTFRWKHARKSVAACRRPIFLDLGEDLLLIGRLYPEPPIDGWGYLWTRQQVVDAINEPLEPAERVAPIRADLREQTQPTTEETA